MSHLDDYILYELRYLIRDLGRGGGLSSPSLYDTAQVLRLTPLGDSKATTAWLLAQQRPDGGWGNPDGLRTRDLPTLAIILALHTLSADIPAAREAVASGLAFLRQHAPQHWPDPLPDDLPVGAELLIPYLLEAALGLKIDVPLAPYAALRRLGEHRRAQIALLKPGAGSTAAHSWEAWGAKPDPALVDGSGGVGHNPTATAAWLHCAAGHPDLLPKRQAARCYLNQAAAISGSTIPGVVPTGWPFPRFEQIFGLYNLLTAGVLDHPALHDLVQEQTSQLASLLGPQGIGQSDFFAPDGDDTAAAITVLQAMGHTVDTSILHQFATGDHFHSYPSELQPSISVTAHAAHALASSGIACPGSWHYLRSFQQPDGRWISDKWHSSWLYTTSQVVVALRAALDYQDCSYEALQRAAGALLDHQRADGGWGIHCSTAEETAYGIIALRQLAGIFDVYQALTRAEQWMLREYQEPSSETIALWVGKDVYCPRRIVRALMLATTLSSAHYTCEPSIYGSRITA
jgi:hypothetical protein